MRIRAFDGADFEVISRLLGRMWHAEHGDHAFWQGADELCAHLSHTDCGLVAAGDDGAFMGAILLAGLDVAERNETLRMHWLQQRTRIAAMATALGVDARADVAVLNEESRLMEQAARQFGHDGVGEIVLLVVDEGARGQGVGQALLDAGLSWFAKHGLGTVRLVTDDACDWQVYEHWHMDRLLEERGMYVYQQELDQLARRA